MIFIKPNMLTDGTPLNVRLPNKPHEFLSSAGLSVERTPYWMRRINDGSVIETTKPKKAAAKQEKQ